MNRVLLIVFWQFSLISGANAFQGQSGPSGAATQPEGITIPAGTEISIRTTASINSKSADKYTEYTASLDDPLIVDGVTILPANSDAWLRVTNLNNPRFSRASMSTALVAVSTRTGERVYLTTGALDSTAVSHVKRTLAETGVGAGVGAAIGSVGGGVGAAIGAAAGGTAGAVVGTVTGNKDGVWILAETRYTYRLTQPVTISYQGLGIQPPVNRSVPRAESASPTAHAPAMPERLSSEQPPTPVTSARAPESPAAPAAAMPKVGETKDQVTGVWGQPERVSLSGSSEVYRYKDFRVLFVDGKVKEVY